MPRQLALLFLRLLLIVVPTGGCAGWKYEVQSSPPPVQPCGVVFAADGAGGFQATSVALRGAIQEAQVPLSVETVPWSHGRWRVFADQIDRGHARAAGLCLATRVAAVRRSHPDCAIYLLGHSAGAAVVLTAAGALPPGSVDQITLLAPSVSADFNLRPVLRCARNGVDVFYSRRDWWFLGVGVALLGTADGRWRPAAGRTGFRPCVETAEDAALYAKLRQHPWDRCVEWTGNHGGHYGVYEENFLRAYVLPLWDAHGL